MANDTLQKFVHQGQPPATRSGWEQLAKSVSGLKARAENAVEKADEIVGRVVRKAELNAGAFAGGWIDGRYQEKAMIWSIPINFAIGVAGTGLALFGIGGEFAQHIDNFSDGFFAAYTTSLGYDFGKQSRPVDPAAAVKGDDDEMDKIRRAG